MSDQVVRKFDFAYTFSSNVDGSANDYGLYIKGDLESVMMGCRSKNAEPSRMYEMMMNPQDLRVLSRILKTIADQMEGFDEC